MLVNNSLVSTYYENKVFKEQDENKNKFQNNLEQENQKSSEMSQKTQFSESSNSLKSGNIYRTQIDESQTISKSEKSVGLTEALSGNSRENELFNINDKMMNTLLKGADEKLVGAVEGAVEGMREKGMSEEIITLELIFSQLDILSYYAKQEGIHTFDELLKIDLSEMTYSKIKYADIEVFLQERFEETKKYNPHKFNFFEEIIANL